MGYHYSGHAHLPVDQNICEQHGTFPMMTMDRTTSVIGGVFLESAALSNLVLTQKLVTSPKGMSPITNKY
jgi:hypothetical protein